MKVNKNYIGKQRKKLNQMRRYLESSQLKAIQNLLPKKVIKKICRAQEYYFRDRFLTPAVTVFHMLNTAFSRENSFQSAWHNIGETGQSGSLSKARQRIPLKIWQQLDKWVVNQIEQEFSPEFQWRGHRVIGVDGTCVSMSNETELTRIFGKSDSKHGISRFPIARVLFAFMLNPLINLGYRIDPFQTSENTLFSRLMKDFRRGDLIIADRRFAGANLYAGYKKAGLEFITPAHQCLKIASVKIKQTLSKNDFIVELPITAAQRRKDPGLPERITVRLIKMRVKVRGKKINMWLITSLLDHKKYPADEIKLWYKRRWKVEGLIEEIKIWLGADVLRSKKSEGIYKELSARVMAFNLIHWVILKACPRHQKRPEQISVSATIRLITVYSLKMSAASKQRSIELNQRLLEKIAHSIVFARPGRSEPRMKRRDQKHYHILKISRTEWRKMNEGIDYVTTEKIRA